MKNRIFRGLFAPVILAVAWPSLISQEGGRWISQDNPAAKYMLEAERQWAESGCTQLQMTRFLANDFLGTNSNGIRYDRTQALRKSDSPVEHDCRLDDAKVRMFGHNVAIVYGSERAAIKGPSGIERIHCFIWTDTWLKRDGKWLMITAQDTEMPCA